ncbi:MAG TPA: hypothetical protein VFS92_06650 [Planctomycetota bacterium]|nr:hypothetical protein [Planctomycetota bacterium]
MSETRNSCEAMGEEVVALVRGEPSAGSSAPVRAHLAACPACAALAADARRLFAAASREPAVAPNAAARSRLSAALDAAWDEEAARDRSRGPVLRLLDAAGRRYSESRAVRFFTFSLGAHAAAALLLAAWIHAGRGDAPEPLRTFVVSTEQPLPPPYDPVDPLRPLPEPGQAVQVPAPPLFPAPAWWPLPDSAAPGHRLPLPPEDPSDSLRIYPNHEFASFARNRFSGRRREALMAKAYGPEEAGAAALSVERGIRWLSGMQDPDGTWASGREGDPPGVRDRFRGGVTAVCLQAYSGDGRTGTRGGPYERTVRAAMAALVRTQDRKTGLLGGFARGPADDRPLCNHGPALEALSEAFGLDWGRLPAKTRDELRGVLERAVAATVEAQRPDGSFGYAPGAPAGDASVTLLQVRGLEAARRAGIAVDPGVLRRSGAWLAARVGDDGRLGYRAPGDRASDATLTAEALPLASALALDATLRDRMRGAVLDEVRSGRLKDRVLFRTAAMEVLVGSGDPEALALAPAAARDLVASQRAPGGFAAENDPYARAAGDALATARAVRALTTPLRTPQK